MIQYSLRLIQLHCGVYYYSDNNTNITIIDAVTYLSAIRPISCPPIAPLIAVHAPNQALLWKNSLAEVTSTLSVNFAVFWFRMILKTDEKPLCDNNNTKLDAYIVCAKAV